MYYYVMFLPIEKKGKIYMYKNEKEDCVAQDDRAHDVQAKANPDRSMELLCDIHKMIDMLASDVGKSPNKDIKQSTGKEGEHSLQPSKWL